MCSGCEINCRAELHVGKENCVKSSEQMNLLKKKNSKQQYEKCKFELSRSKALYFFNIFSHCERTDTAEAF